jgi:thioredoxin 1
MKIIFTLAFIFFALAAVAADSPYNETADAKLDIKQAWTEATAAKKPLIVVFGANWCGDCKMLEYSMQKGASAALMAQDFKIVKVNVGRFDKNVDVAKAYGVSLEKGIPAVAIISTNYQVIYVTREGELADARKMGDQGIYDFFKKVTTAPAAKN